MMASSAFHAGYPEVSEIETAYHTLTPLLGAGAAGVFLLSLIVSGISASTVGTMAGQLIPCRDLSAFEFRSGCADW